MLVVTAPISTSAVAAGNSRAAVSTLLGAVARSPAMMTMSAPVSTSIGLGRACGPNSAWMSERIWTQMGEGGIE